MAPPSQLIGQTIAHYRILEKLGAGGMGEVYRALDLRLRRDVAIKILPALISSDPDRLRRFEQEGAAAAALNHPNILAVHEMGSHQGVPYLVSELLQGETLRDMLRRGRLPYRRAIDYGVQVARALAAAHDAGIVHRDLKPENLFVLKDGRIKILDFGLAKLVGNYQAVQHDAPTMTAGTEVGVVMGTVGYMSPEQVRGQPADHRTDIFSFGAILYEMLAGTRTFQKPTSADTMSAILNEDPPPISEVAPELPPALQRVVHRCLEKGPAQRFQSASDLAFALEAVSDIHGQRASTGKGLQPPGRRTANYPGLTRGIALAIAGLAVLALVAIWWNSPPAAPRVLNYTQITNDGRRKSPTGVEMAGMVNDGSRVFFTEGSGDSGLVPTLAQVSTEGGETVPLQVPFARSVILDISPAGSELLVASYSDTPDLDQALWAVPVLGGSPRRLGNVNSLFAAWSPDGKKLVYAQGSDIYVASHDGTDAHKLVTVPGILGWVMSYIPDWVRWSPDSRRIRFSVQDPRTLSFALWEIFADGTNLHPLLPGWNNPAAECCGMWTRDGRYFIFQSTRNGRTDLWALPERGSLLRPAARKPQQLTAGPISFLSPDTSRNGSEVFALGVQKKNELVRFDPLSKQFAPYLSGMSAEGVAFSKDGQWITYVEIPQGTLWRSKLDGSARLQLSFPPLQTASPRWSPDGTQIAFMGRLPGKLWQIYVVSAQGGTPQQVVSDEYNEGEPDWSASGNQLVFSQFPEVESKPPNNGSVRVLDLKSHQISILAKSEGLYWARWSGDGRYITAATADQSALFRFAVLPRKWTTLSHLGGVILGWSRNDRFVYFEHDNAIYRASVDGGGLEQVVSLKSIQRGTGILGFQSWTGLAPDDSVLLLREASHQEIYSLTLGLR